MQLFQVWAGIKLACVTEVAQLQKAAFARLTGGEFVIIFVNATRPGRCRLHRESIREQDLQHKAT